MHAPVHLGDNAYFVLANNIGLGHDVAAPDAGQSAEAEQGVLDGRSVTAVLLVERLRLEQGFVRLDERDRPRIETVGGLLVDGSVPRALGALRLAAAPGAAVGLHRHRRHLGVWRAAAVHRGRRERNTEMYRKASLVHVHVHVQSVNTI